MMCLSILWFQGYWTLCRADQPIIQCANYKAAWEAAYALLTA